MEKKRILDELTEWNHEKLRKEYGIVDEGDIVPAEDLEGDANE